MPITTIENSGSTVTNARKPDNSDKLKVSENHHKIFSKALQQARVAKKMSQKELASKVNVKLQVMGDYESGKSVPTGQIICKIEKILDIKLPRLGMKPTIPGTSSKIGVAKVGSLNIED